jgi:putative tricarboxylic transport membrane protein
MHKEDLYTGLILFCLGSWIAWQTSDFPALAGMPYGAGLFPMIAAVGMGVCGALIFIGGLVTTTADDQPTDTPPARRGSRRGLLNSLACVAAVIFYAVFLDRLGFHTVSFVVLFVLFCILRVRWWLSLLLAVSVTAAVHYIFYSLLHVPLPWGLFEPIAW